jgi:hypothetical protein
VSVQVNSDLSEQEDHMTDDDYDYDDDEQEQEQDERPARSDSEWAKLRRAEKAKNKAEAELAAMKREKAFMRAGIDTDDPRLSYFVKAYDGDVTPEAIRAEAVRAGFIQEPTDDPDPQEVADAQYIAQAGLGAPAEGGLGVDTAALDQAFREGGSDGMIAYLQQIGVPVNYGQ